MLDFLWRFPWLLLLIGHLAGIYSSTGAEAAISCTASVTTLNYGTFVSPSAAINSTATVSIGCTTSGLTSVRICVSMADPSIPMSSGSNSLAQNLYKDTGRSVLFGSYVTSPTGGTQVDVTSSLGGAANATVTIYGRVPLGHSAQPGSYSVTMPVTNLLVAARENTSDSCTNISTTTANAYRQTVSPPLTAMATVEAACAVSATNMSFPTSGVLSAAKDATSTLSLTCTNGLPYSIALSGGSTNAVDPTARKMTNGAHQITYGLYRDSARSLPWGSTAGTNTQSGTGTGSSQSFSVYGRVPAQPAPAPGSYSDTVVVTVSY